MRRVWLVVLVAVAAQALRAEEKLRVGVTTHAYYSWVARVGQGTPIEVVPLVPAGQNLHAFQPRASDIARVARCEVLVANGLGHDAFLDKLLQAAGKSGIQRIDLHRGVPLLRYQRPAAGGHDHGKAAHNPHTFLSLSTAIQQIYNLEQGLAALLPAHAARLRSNARAYARVLRKLKAGAARRLLGARSLAVATVHDGYAYLLGELGIRVTAVIEPRHGIEPSAGELARTTSAIRAAKVQVVFSELDFPARHVELIRKQTGVRVLHLRHISRGAYIAEKFEQEMAANLETLVEALVGK